MPAVEHEQAVLLRGAQLEGEAARGWGLPARQHLNIGFITVRACYNGYTLTIFTLLWRVLMLKVDQWKLMTTDRMRINGIRASVPTPRVHIHTYTSLALSFKM